jgi:hypothetical protein
MPSPKEHWPLVPPEGPAGGPPEEQRCVHFFATADERVEYAELSAPSSKLRFFASRFPAANLGEARAAESNRHGVLSGLLLGNVQNLALFVECD